LRNAGVGYLAVFVLSQNTKAIKGEESTTTFYLQRLNRQWGCYINMDSVEDTKDGDKLTVAKIKSKSHSDQTEPAEPAHDQADSSTNDVSCLISCS